MMRKRRDKKRRGGRGRKKRKRRKKAKLFEPLIFANYYAECFICLISINLHSEAFRLVILFSHSIGEETEAQRVK